MTTTTNRKDEIGTVPERSSRFLQKNGYWYYSTREGIDMGPFDTREDAVEGVAEFIDYICGADPKFQEALRQYKSKAA